MNVKARISPRIIETSRNPITAAQTNMRGDLLAYAVGDDFHQGVIGEGKWNTDLAVCEMKECYFNKNADPSKK